MVRLFKIVLECLGIGNYFPTFGKDYKNRTFQSFLQTFKIFQKLGEPVLYTHYSQKESKVRVKDCIFMGLA